MKKGERAALVGVLWLLCAAALGAQANTAWKPSLELPNDPFFAPYRSDAEPRWAKFVLRRSDAGTVFFQDSTRYAFHYDFVRQHLDGYRGISLAEFERLALHAATQELVLGAVLAPPFGSPNEFAIELVRRDAYSVDEIERYVRQVARAVSAPAGAGTFYFPVANQLATALARRDELLRRGIQLDGVERWRLGDACYSAGWSLGALRFVLGSEIEEAYADGRLAPRDIVLTDLVPAEIPYLAGVLALRPATPSSHVAILAQDWGVPFAYLATAELQQRAREWVGREVLVRAEQGARSCEVRLDLVPDNVSTSEREALRALLEPPPLVIAPAASRGAIAIADRDLEPSDLRFVGGKAAHYGLLRDAIPANSQAAIGVTFDLWQGFLDQRLDGGNTLRAEIGARLASFAWPPDVPALRAALDEVRGLIEDETDFSPAQKSALEAALAPFDPLRRIRFRSSTNFEDTEGSTGAGLYESQSGCLADDQDADEQGPSRCDPAQPRERGIYRAVRRVYASFYNDNAFLERLRRGVRESEVAMGMLVHHSYPDEIEMANGVAQLTVGCDYCPVEVVAQVGAVSVTNPESGEIPEQTQVGASAVAVLRDSSLLQRGATVLSFPGEYQQLDRLVRAVAAEYQRRVPGGGEYRLEMEWKKVVPGRLELKQVRRVPLRGQVSGPRFVMDAPLRRCVLQGEIGRVGGHHRLKAQLDLTTDSRFLDAPSLASSFYAASRYRSRRRDGAIELVGPPASWPGATYSWVPGDPGAGELARLDDGFTLGDGAARRSLTLHTTVPGSSRSPVLTSPDLWRMVSARYAAPQVDLEPFGAPGTTLEDMAPLGPCPDDWPGDPARRSRQERVIGGEGGLVVRTVFEWPEPPSDPVAGYTAPAIRFVDTVIEGLSGSPIDLRGTFSQTYRPAHHNFGEEFLFEPGLDEGADPQLVAALEQQDIRMIYVVAGYQGGSVRLVGRDGAVRVAPAIAVPRDLSARAVSATSIELQWRDAGGGASETLVEQGGASGFVPIATVAAGQTRHLVTGLLANTRHEFRVRARRGGVLSLYSNVAAARTGGGLPCVAGAVTLCLAGGRFEVRARFRDQYNHRSGDAAAVPGSDTTGLFWFFTPANLELAVKVLDGRPVNGKFWLFYGALSDVEYWVEVRDSETGELRTYHNAPGSFCGRGDVGAFAGGATPALRAVPLEVGATSATSATSAAGAAPSGACTPADDRLCLHDRFAIGVSFRSHDGASGSGQVIPSLTSDRSGGFSFFRDGNYELLVKLLDGTTVNGRLWLFFGALSDVAYTVRVLDTTTGAERSYHNSAGTLCGQRDVDAF